MDEMEIIKLNPAFSDDRGAIIDLIDNDTINAVTLITFKKGAVRANHFHKKTVQWNYVISGKIRLVTQFVGGEKNERILGKGEFAVTRENESHALQAVEEAEVLILTKGPRAGTDYENDTFRLDVPLIDSKREN
jgi:quercetin dioxygenase-like cupin family protein